MCLPDTFEEAVKRLNDALKCDIEALKCYGVTTPKKQIIKNIGIKYYLLFWKRKLLISKQALKCIIEAQENKEIK